MQELLTLILAQLRNIWRFRWIALGIAWVIALVGWLYVYSLPDQYQSSARVHIDTQSAISPLLSGMAITPNADEQVNLLIKTVMSRPHLRDIARATGLDLTATTPSQEQALIDGLQHRLSLNNTGGNTDVYSIGYTSGSAKTAQAVVQEVISIMTTINLSSPAAGQNSSQAVSFLNQEVDKYRDKLTETEKALAQFKKNHAELMPGTDDYVSRLQSLNASIDSLQDQLASARDRRANIAQQMQGGGGSGVPPAQSVQIQRLDSQIDQQQQQLSQMLTKYTPEHPDVIAARRALAQLKSRRESELANLRAHPSRIQVPEGAGSGPDSGLVGQLNDAKVQISTLESSLQRKQSQLTALRSGADDMNDAQAQLAELSRNYQVTRDQYEKLLSRLYSARLSTDVQKSSGGLEFRVIDPPEVPAEPSGPPRVILMIMSLLGAVAAGVVFALFLAQIRPVFSSRRTLTQATGYPVLGSISMALTPGERARRRSAIVVFAVCGLSLVLGLALAILIEPLATAVVPNLLSPTL